MYKKIIYALLITAIITSFALYHLYFKDYSHAQVKQQEVVMENVKQAKLAEEVTSKAHRESGYKLEVLNEITNCDDLNAHFPEAMEYIDRAVEDIFLSKGEYSKTGGYSTMSETEFESLVKSGDATALTLKGSRLVWEGIQGMSSDELMKLYNTDKDKYAEWYSNFKIDYEKISAGEEYQYQAGLRGKLGAIWESLLQKNVLVRQMMWREVASEDVYAQIIEKKALLKIWQQLNKNNPEVLTLLNADTMHESLNEVLAEYGKQYKKSVDQEEFSRKTNEVVNKFLVGWEKDRAYLGEELYLRFVPENFSQHAQKALALSCWNNN